MGRSNGGTRTDGPAPVGAQSRICRRTSEVDGPRGARQHRITRPRPWYTFPVHYWSIVLVHAVPMEIHGSIDNAGRHRRAGPMSHTAFRAHSVIARYPMASSRMSPTANQHGQLYGDENAHATHRLSMLGRRVLERENSQSISGATAIAGSALRDVCEVTEDDGPAVIRRKVASWPETRPAICRWICG